MVSHKYLTKKRSRFQKSFFWFFRSSRSTGLDKIRAWKMAKQHGGIKFFLISTIVLAALVPAASPAEDEGSLLDLAQSLLQESVRNQNGNSGLNILSGLVQGFMQTEGGKQLGDMLTKSKGNSLDLLSNLASIWQASKFSFSTTDESGTKRDLNLDPSILGSVVDLISTLNKASNDADNNNVDENNNEKEETGHSTHGKEDSSINWEAMLSFAGNMLSSMSNSNQQKDENVGSAGGLESFLSFLPVLMNSLAGQHNPHSSHSIPHHTHPQFLPPFLENLHEYWDHFSNSEFGRTLWENSGLSELVKAFSNGKGELDMEKVFESLENNSFRRRWIKGISSFIAQWVKHFTNPEIQKSYLETGQIVCNSFLKAQGYPKETLIDLKKPAKSISSLTNAVFKRQFNLKVNSEVYVGPAVAYVQELFKIGQKKGFGMLSLSSEDIESKLSETIESDVIEPVVRINRVYKFALKRPECSRYVICTINKNQKDTGSGLKPGITKLASLGASWFISGQKNIPFWDLYEAAVEGISCSKFNKNCSEFHVEDIKATTEYYHNEL